MLDDSVGDKTPEFGGLVPLISALLAKHAHPQPRSWEAQVNQDVFQSNNEKLQRFLINRYWRQQLSAVPPPSNTMDERFCLIDDGSIEDWLRLFEQRVVPCILQHNLPHTPR